MPTASRSGTELDMLMWVGVARRGRVGTSMTSLSQGVKLSPVGAIANGIHSDRRNALKVGVD